MFLVIDLARLIVNVGWGALIVLLFILLYALLLKRLKRGQIPQEEYIELYPLETEFAVGTVQFFFKTKVEKHVLFRIYSFDEQLEEVLSDQLYKPGGHILQLDTTKLPNGKYFFELKTDNQKTSKLMEVRN